LSYHDRLATLNLPSLELRRLRTDLTWCYKILFGVLDMPVVDFFELVLLSTHMACKKKRSCTSAGRDENGQMDVWH